MATLLLPVTVMTGSQLRQPHHRTAAEGNTLPQVKAPGSSPRFIVVFVTRFCIFCPSHDLSPGFIQVKERGLARALSRRSPLFLPSPVAFAMGTLALLLATPAALRTPRLRAMPAAHAGRLRSPVRLLASAARAAALTLALTLPLPLTLTLTLALALPPILTLTPTLTLTTLTTLT